MFTVYLVVFGGFACLFPLAFYCLMVASWNGRRRPLLVTGPADIAGVLLATSGFLIAGGPLILTLLHERSRRAAEYPNFAAAWSAQAGLTWPWLCAWAGYFLLVVGGTMWLLIRRRPIAVIYNIDPADADDLVSMVLKRLGLPLIHHGAGYFIAIENGTGPGRAVLEVTVMPVMRHAVLRWSSVSGGVRRRVEAEIGRVVAEMAAPANPTAGWFLTAATGLFSLLLALLALFVFQVWRVRG